MLAVFSTLIISKSTRPQSRESKGLRFKMESLQHLNPSGGQGSTYKRPSGLDSLEVGYIGDFKRGDWGGVADVDLKYILEKDAKVMTSLNEAYVSLQREGGSRYRFGQQILDWAPYEQFWQLRHLNGQRFLRLMDNKQHGNLGLFYSRRLGQVETEMFASLFYIPNINPRFHVKDGNVISSSGWARTPPRRTSLGEGNSEIKYHLKLPPYREVFIQKSLGANFKLPVSSLFEASAFAIYKPETSLRLNGEAFYDSQGNAVLVNGHPIVNHHLMTGFQVAGEAGNISWRGGLTYVEPSAELGRDLDTLTLPLRENHHRRQFSRLQTEFIEILPVYEREVFAHAKVGWKWPWFGFDFNALHYFSQHDSNDLYSLTNLWQSALGVGGRFFLSDQYLAQGSFRYDTARKDNLIHFDLTYLPLPSFSLGIGVELIKAPNVNSYWSAYRTEDTFFIRVQHTL